MAVVSLTSSPSTLDAGTSETVSVTNTGTVAVTVTRGSQVVTLQPTQLVVVYPEGTAVTALVTLGSGQVTTSATSKSLLNASDPVTLAANAAFTGTYLTQASATSTYVHTLGAASGTDDTTAIQAALTACRLAGGGRVIGLPGQSYRHSSRLVIGSGTTLDLRGCTLTQVAASHTQMIVNYSYANAVATATDAAVGSGSNVVTTALGATAVVGQSLIVAAAGGNGNGVLVGKISSKTSNTITLVNFDGSDCTATATVSAAAVSLYNRDSNITVLGGTWSLGANHPVPLPAILMYHVDNPTVDIDQFTSTGTASLSRAIGVASVTNFVTSVRSLNTVGVGVQITGPAYGGSIPYVAGYCTDDLLALACTDYGTDTGSIGGDITDVTIGTVVGVNTAAHMLNVLAGAGRRIDQIKVTGRVSGTCGGNQVVLGDDGASASTIGGSYGDIDLGYVSCKSTGGSILLVCPIADRIRINLKYYPLSAGHSVALSGATTSGTIKRLELSGVSQGALGDGASFFTMTSANQTVESLVLDGVVMDPASSAGWRALASMGVGATSSTIKHLTLRNCRLNAPNGYSAHGVRWLAGTIERITFEGGFYNGQFGNLVRCGTTGNTTVVTFSNTAIKGGSRVAENYGSDPVFVLDNPRIESMASELFYTSGGTLTVSGTCIRATSPVLFLRAASEALRANGQGLGVDVGTLTPSSGDAAFNTNASSAPFVTGPAIYDGSRWKNLATAATKTGTATLSGGTVTISDASITANSIIRLAGKTAGGTPGALYISARSAGTSFAITSTSNTDTSVVQYYIDAY